MGLPALKYDDLPHYTYEDYTHWQGQWEVICGIPYALAPAPGMKHQRISFNIASQLNRFLKESGSRCRMYQAIDWEIAEDTIVQPDVLVVCGDVIENKKLEIPPVIVFEVLSPSTGRKDRIVKFRLYQEAGVKYYCMVSLDSPAVEVYQMKGPVYDKEDEGKDGKLLFDIGECEFALDVHEIFQE
jgi:Uma2 family endonuclease